jgi:hypothetical protein
MALCRQQLALWLRKSTPSEGGQRLICALYVRAPDHDVKIRSWPEVRSGVQHVRESGAFQHEGIDARVGETLHDSPKRPLSKEVDGNGLPHLGDESTTRAGGRGFDGSQCRGENQVHAVLLRDRDYRIRNRHLVSAQARAQRGEVRRVTSRTSGEVVH